MTEIIKRGYYKKPILNFHCVRCNTQFRTDEWLPLHPLRIVGEKGPSGPPSYYTTCPVCRNSVKSEFGS